jgi:4'-phosphopantetheinyl transferase
MHHTPDSPVNLCPGTNVVEVWRVRLAADADVVEALGALLSTDERERAGRFHLPAHRNRYIMTRGVLRVLLGRYARREPREVRFSYGPLGKPSLVSEADTAALHFNVSHSHDRALCAFASGDPLGVDIERIRANADCRAIAARFFAPSEQVAIGSFDEPDRVGAFFACWTRKEAMLKALGLGVPADLRRIEVSCRSGEPPGIVRLDAGEIDLDGWSLNDIDVGPLFRAALAVRRRRPTIIVRDIDPGSGVGGQSRAESSSHFPEIAR